ncbi:MAG: hypothetical protein QOI83_870 [Streptomycetaceae bacterium]|jgi:hypothetical protein|nr:hypothetical protein [Streptomycetaceae bacterium]
MTHTVVSVGRDAPFKEIVQIHAEGTLVGVVSRSGLLKVFLRPDLDIAQEIRGEVLVRVFPGEPSPVGSTTPPRPQVPALPRLRTLRARRRHRSDGRSAGSR